MTSIVSELSIDVVPQVLSPCMEKLNERTWYTTLAVRTGPVHAGIRVDTSQTADRIESLLAPVRSPEYDDRVWPNFSVRLGDDAYGGRRSLKLVYRDHDVVARRRDTTDLLLDLVELLDELPLILGVDDAPVVHATGVLGPRGVLLMPARYHKPLLIRRQQLEDVGLELLGGRTFRLSSASAEVALGIWDPALRSLLVSHAQIRHVGAAPLSTWCQYAVVDEPKTLRTAKGVFAAFQTVLNHRTLGPAETLRCLSEVAVGGRTRFVALPHLPPASLAAVAIDLCS